MSKELDEMRKEVADMVCTVCRKSPECDLRYCRLVDQILKASTKDCRIAVVRKEPIFPILPLGYPRECHTAQMSMVNAGFVQEVRQDG